MFSACMTQAQGDCLGCMLSGCVLCFLMADRLDATSLRHSSLDGFSPRAREQVGCSSATEITLFFLQDLKRCWMLGRLDGAGLLAFRLG